MQVLRDVNLYTACPLHFLPGHVAVRQMVAFLAMNQHTPL